MTESNWYWHRIAEDNMQRMWARYKKYKAHLEVVYGKRASVGASIHIGDRGSETPVDLYLGLGVISFYGDFYYPGLRRHCELIGRGHKRDISLKVHDGSLWWKLWYDDDGGMDVYHKCDKRRRPKLYPWRWGRDKYRGWMCLRDGNIDLNPLTAFWGLRYYHYEDLEKQDALLHINDFPGDNNYLVHFTLRKQTRHRCHGPKWVRWVSDEGYCASWSTDGIPIRNHDWKGDDIIASSETVATRENWVDEALMSLKRRIRKDRKHYNYRPRLEQ